MELVSSEHGVSFNWTWSGFESTRTSSFRELRQANELFDVTLCCDNGTDTIPAHKVILAASSPLFRRILALNKHKSMFLYLKGVHLKELECILDFMYNGHVSVEQDSLGKLLAVAGELEVKGFTALEQNEETTLANLSSGSSPRRIEPESAREPSKNFTTTSKRKVDFDHDIGVDDMLDAYLKKTKIDSGKQGSLGDGEESMDDSLQAIHQPKVEPSDPDFTDNDTSVNSEVGTPRSSGDNQKRSNVDRNRTEKIKPEEEDDRLEAVKQAKAEPNDSGITDNDTSRDSGSSEILEKVKFLKSKRGFPVLVDSEGYTYLMSNQKSDHLYWVCQRARLENCRGTVITKGFHLARRNIPHCHAPRLPPTNNFENKGESKSIKHEQRSFKEDCQESC